MADSNRLIVFKVESQLQSVLIGQTSILVTAEWMHAGRQVGMHSAVTRIEVWQSLTLWAWLFTGRSGLHSFGRHTIGLPFLKQQVWWLRAS